jgi:hypothetical protein
MNRFTQQSLLALASILLTLAAPTFGQKIYKTVDEHGNVTYTDNPTKEAKEVDLPTINSQLPPNADSAPLYPSRDKAIKYAMTITEPANDTAIPPGQLSFSVKANIQPAPSAPLIYSLIVDGQEQQTARTPLFVIDNPYRGSHSISIEAKLDGKKIASTQSITIHVIRTNVAR